MGKENLRGLSLDVVMEVLEKGGFSNRVLGNVLSKYQYLEKNERSFVTRLSLGTIENALLLDEVLNTYSKTKVRKMKPVIRNILRLSVYQIYFMDSVPESAVVNEAVKLSKKRGMAGLSGFVNGILRSILREEKPITEFATDLSKKYSCPEWLIKLWEQDYGKEKLEEILLGFEGKGDITIRVNLTKNSPNELKSILEQENLTVQPTNIPYGFRVFGIDYLEKLTSFKEGRFYVQDLSSMQVAQRADIKGGEKILDVCAAPGGKSLHMAEILGVANNGGLVEARDLSEEKVSIINENIKRSGLTNISAKVWDATKFDEDAKEQYDVVVCDLPCSGLGVLGKKPEIKYRVKEEDIASLAKLQRDILTNGKDYVKDGGRLIFSTCTVNKTENDDNTKWFLDHFSEYTLLSEEQIFPKKNEMDGFYIAVFEKHE
ncbi:MAG: 16S rRNA (cytosine(967)-C(5))-methyltransferase RsmB [Lachnospiraceae bacterium]|nr:16S rRNA (cytosine(967)-C(5))-methyltransferase RsmB [Lachnospiraceae bacterium]